MNKTAIVTGGCGFIGSHLVDLLIEKKFRVIVIDNLISGKLKNIKNNKNITFINKNINEIKLSNLPNDINNCYLFHFAGLGDVVPSINFPKQYMETNVFGTINLLEIARKLEVKKFIYAASSSCYGITNKRNSEKAKINITHPYALSKYMGESVIKYWSTFFKIPYISIRIFNAYGRRSRTTGAYGAVLGVFLKQKIENKPLTIVGSGLQKRDFVHVKDVANAFYLAANSKLKNRIYNLGSDKPISINKLAKKISNKSVSLAWRPGEPRLTHANINKIRKELKWKPKISFDMGIEEILENIDEWSDAPLWNKKNITKVTKEWFEFLS